MCAKYKNFLSSSDLIFKVNVIFYLIFSFNPMMTLQGVIK